MKVLWYWLLELILWEIYGVNLFKCDRNLDCFREMEKNIYNYKMLQLTTKSEQIKFWGLVKGALEVFHRVDFDLTHKD